MGINVNTTAGSKLYISSTLPATEDVAGFEDIIDFTKISRITNFGDILQAFDRVNFSDTETRNTYTLKGQKQATEITIQLGRVASDAGQQEVLTAFESDEDYSFYIETQDGTKWYFVGKVMDTTLNLGEANTVIGRNIVIALNSDIVTDEPSS